jgi:LysR family transcriptional regulator, glycine cleavage system transcriptional activator
MRRRLPPLSALRAFEAAARHRSFKDAAKELAVTPTAISHQVRSLEDYAGTSLFERRTRQVVLTDAGEQLLPVLRDGFDSFAAAIERLTRPRRRTAVTISATVAFTARWLVPRVTGFQALHPRVDLRIHASDEILDLDAAGVDIAIRYGEGRYPGLAVVPLFADRFAPVFHPTLAIDGPAALATAPLIAFEWRRRHPRNPTWARWFAAAGLAAPADPSLLTFSDESHAIQAAVAAQGVALASLPLVADELAAGRLVQPFGPVIESFRHHLVTASEHPSPDVVAVLDWLRQEAESVDPRGWTNDAR